MARRQLGIIGAANVTGHFGPGRLVTFYFQPVSETRAVRRREIQTRVVNLQALFACWNCHSLKRSHVEAVGVLLLTLYERGFNHHRRRVWIDRELSRVHGCQSLGGGKPKLSIASATGC